MKLNKKTFMIAGAAAMLTTGAAIPSFAATSGWATVTWGLRETR